MFWRSPPVIPTHPPGTHGPSGATNLCVSLVVDPASDFAGSALSFGTLPDARIGLLIVCTETGRYSDARIFSQANHCLTKSYLEPYVSVQMRPLVHDV